MKKDQKIKYIEEVKDRFENARNHGRNGNNWWYPTPNTIAYNVKLHGRSKTIEDIREKMTARQNDFYSDEGLYEITAEAQNDEARMFSDDIDEEFGVKSGYAGRSGGWLEVAYPNTLGDDYLGNEVDYFYKEAKKLEELEGKVANRIKGAHEHYQKYINTEQYCLDIVDTLMTDEAIADHYKGKIRNLTDKLK